MAIQPTLMRNVGVSVLDSTLTTPAHIAIGGVTQISHSPSTETADATTFDAAGRTRNLSVSRGDEFTITALRLEDEGTGDRDPGQDRAETLAAEIGQAALEEWKLTFAGGGTMTFTAHAQVQYTGGGVNDLANWEATVTVYGTPTFA